MVKDQGYQCNICVKIVSTSWTGFHHRFFWDGSLYYRGFWLLKHRLVKPVMGTIWIINVFFPKTTKEYAFTCQDIEVQVDGFKAF